MSDWATYQKSVIRYPDIGFTLDTSRMNAPSEWSAEMQSKIARAFRDRAAIEAGEIMNPDEDRAVGHYWLRNPDLAPEEEGAWIRDVKNQVEDLAGKILRGEIKAPNDRAFRHILLVGIGESTFTPQSSRRYSLFR
jgi:glucose-6-phosphate isomerase